MSDKFPHRKNIDPSKVPQEVHDSMATLAALLIATRQPNLKAGIEIDGRFFKIEVTEAASLQELHDWNGPAK